MRIELIAASLVLLTIGLLSAAVPPLPEKALREGADVIVTGVVTKVEWGRILRDDPEYSDLVLAFTIRVDKTEKGVVATKTVVAHAWQPEKRPKGWAGHQGQNVIPKEGAEVRAYLLVRLGTGEFTVMEPNGLEELKASTKPSR